jgi:hypothetical protein
MITEQITHRVMTLLKQHPHLRDSDEKLVANVWHNEIGNPSAISAFAMLELYANGKLTNSDYITRVRRKLQEEYPELRGKLYKERHKKQELIKHQLGYQTSN